MKSLSLVTLRLAVLIAVLSWSFVDVATACNSCLTTCTLCKKDTTCGVCNLAVESQSSSAQTTGYVLLNSKWNLGPNNATFIDPNNPPATPGSVTWSPLPNGVSGNVSGYDGHPDNSTDIEFLITGAVDGLEYQLFNEALDVWASHASIYNLGQVADSGAAVGASEVQGGHIGDIRVGGFTFDGPGGGLAHALQPAVEWMGTTFGGDVHFDIGENWTNGGGGGTDFKTVAIHELGHSLGLGHSNATFSVMAPFYAGIQHNLYRDDIVGIQALYGTDYAANASFNSGSDTNTLNIDFGSFTLGDPAAPISFDISNLQQVGSTATLSSSNVVGSGSTVALTTDYSSFSYLVAGTTSNSFDAMIDTTVPGVHAATYEFNFTDVTGANQTITLNLTGEVSNVDDPNRPDMVYNVATGEVIIDQRDVSTLNSYNFDSAGQFIPGNHTPFLLGGIPNSTVNNISDVSTIPSSAPTSIGAILPSGLSLGDLANLLDTRTATTMFGQPTVDFDIDFVCGGGDADCDGYVSNLEDIQQAFTNFTGPGTTTSNFSLLRADGDVQGDLLGIGDDDVDNLDIQAMFTNFNAAGCSRRRDRWFR